MYRAPRPLVHFLLFILLVLSPKFAPLIPGVQAQFGFFDQFFQGGHEHQQHFQHHGRTGGGGASAWTVHFETVQCSQYLCPKTLDCVAAPHDCPCPHAEDIKCLVPDAAQQHAATVLCVRGEKECAEVDMLATPWRSSPR